MIQLIKLNQNLNINLMTKKMINKNILYILVNKNDYDVKKIILYFFYDIKKSINIFINLYYHLILNLYNYYIDQYKYLLLKKIFL